MRHRAGNDFNLLRPRRRQVVAVAALVTALNFTAASWLPMIAGLALIGMIYGAIGALGGAVLDKLAATYLILFLVMTDFGGRAELDVSHRTRLARRPAAGLRAVARDV